MTRGEFFSILKKIFKYLLTKQLNSDNLKMKFCFKNKQPEGGFMKKIFMLCMALTLTFSLFLTACNIVGSGSGSKTSGGGNPPEPPEPEVRSIYLVEGETYNLAKQLEYEEKTVSDCTLTADKTTFSVETGEYECANFTYKNGVITAKAVDTEDYTANDLTLTYGATTENLFIHVVNYEKYGNTMSAPDVGRLYGKKVVFFGDSITDDNAAWWETNTWWDVTKEGKYNYENGRPKTITGIKQNYVTMLDKICDFATCTNPAIAGALCSHYNAQYASKSISIPTQIKNNISVVKAADYVFVMGGTNDSFEINKRDSVLKLGNKTDLATEEAFADSVNDKPVSTFYGYYNYILKTLRETNPKATLICLSNIPCQSTYGYTGGVSNGHNNEGIAGVNVAISNSAQIYKARYVDIFSAIPKTNKGEYTKVWFTNDELHPNEVAYELITDKILSGK